MDMAPRIEPVSDDARSMCRLFDGKDDSFYTYDPATIVLDAKGKQKPKYLSVEQPVTPEVWQAHLDSRQPLVLVPIRHNDTCVWGAIDIDQYDGLDHADLVRQCAALGLPLVVCRSKSGGAHLFLFADEPVPAAAMRVRLRAMADVLGRPTAEIFPKQDRLENKGSALNMPYLASVSPAIRPDGSPMALHEFVELAETSRQPESFFAAPSSAEARSKASDTDNTGTGLMPPKATPADARRRLNLRCEQVRLAAPADANNRLVSGAFDMGRFCRDTGLSADEARAAMLNAWTFRKSGETGAEREFDEVWSRAFANGQQQGRMATSQVTGSLPDIERCWIIPDDEHTTFRLQIDGREMTVGVAEFLDQRKFNNIALLAIGRAFHLLGQKQRNLWIDMVNDARSRAEIDPLTGGVSRGEVFRDMIEDFVTNRHRAKNKDEIVLGKPWHDEEGGQHIFRMKDLRRFLDLCKSPFAKETDAQLASRIRRMGGGDVRPRVKGGKQPNAWWVPDSDLVADPTLDPRPIPDPI